MSDIQRPPILRLRLRDGIVLDPPAVPDGPGAAGREVGSVLSDLVDQLDDAVVVWYEERLESIVSDPDGWGALVRHPRELLHLGFLLTPPAILGALQAVAGESPFVLPAAGVPRRPTWLISAGAGVATVAALRLAGGLSRELSSLPARWADFGLRGFRHGLLAFHDERLLRETSAAPSPDRWDERDLGVLVRRQWGRRGRWLLWLDRRRRRRPGTSTLAAAVLPAAVNKGDAEETADDATVDVVIPTLNRRELLLATLDDLARQSLLPQRVVVVEQGPEDALAADLRQRSDPFELIHLRTERIGASRARNLAVERTTGRWIALVDDDVRLPPEYLAQMVAEAVGHGASVVNARTLAPGEEPDPDPRPARLGAGLGSGRALISRRAVVAVGGFDERLEGWGEDFELGFRLNLHGYPVVESERSHLVHLAAPSGGLRAQAHRRQIEPWRRGWLRPKPSPLIVYRWRRWLTPAMLRGARRRYFLDAVRGHRFFPASIALLPLLWLRWRRSLSWARRLATIELADLRLVIVSHVPHYRWQGQIFAYAPYAREIDVWADLVSSVTVAAPQRPGPPPGDAVAFSRRNVVLAPQTETGGPGLGARLRQLVLLPVLLFSLSRTLRRADAIHVRCPGNLGLLGALLGPVFSRRLVAKYAGQWTPYPGEPWSYRLQRAILRSSWWRGPVTVYGDWPDQPGHVVPFFTSVLDRSHLERAREAARRPRVPGPLRVLYVGRLSRPKNVDRLLGALGRVAKKAAVSATILGDGPEREALEALACRLGLSSQVTFTGGLPFPEVLDLYERHDVLVLISETEGWPKAITEAMAFGLVCIGSERGLIPQLLAAGRGIVIPPGDEERLAAELTQIARAPERYEAMRRRAAAWAREHSLESLRQALSNLLANRWGCRGAPIP